MIRKKRGKRQRKSTKAPWKPGETVRIRFSEKQHREALFDYLKHVQSEVRRLQAIVWTDLADHQATIDLRIAERELAWATAQIEPKSRPSG